MTTTLITFDKTPPASTFVPNPTPAQSQVRKIDLRADRILPGDVLLVPNGNIVKTSTVVRSVPDRKDSTLSRITVKVGPTWSVRRDEMFTVLRGA